MLGNLTCYQVFTTMAKKIEDEETTESKELLQTVKSDSKSGTWKLGRIIGVFLVLVLSIVGIVLVITHFNTKQATSDEITIDYYNDYEQNDVDYIDEYPDVEGQVAGSSSKIADIQNVSLNLYLKVFLLDNEISIFSFHGWQVSGLTQDLIGTTNVEELSYHPIVS